MDKVDIALKIMCSVLIVGLPIVLALGLTGHTVLADAGGIAWAIVFIGYLLVAVWNI